MTVLKIPTAGVECIRYFIGPLDLVVIDGIEHCWVSTDENGHVLSLRNEPERHVSFTHNHYYQLVRSNRCARHGGYFSEGKARARNAVKWVPISTLPEHVSRKTLTYGDALDIFIDMRNAYRRGERDDGRKVNTGDPSLSWVLPEIEAELHARQKALGKRGGKAVKLVSLTSPRDFRRKLHRYIESGLDKRIGVRVLRVPQDAGRPRHRPLPAARRRVEAAPLHRVRVQNPQRPVSPLVRGANILRLHRKGRL